MLIKGHFFPGQKSNERLVLFIRRHWITYIPWIALIAILILLPWVINGIFNALDISLIDIFNDLANITDITADDIWINNVTIIILSSYYLFLAAYFLKMWIDYYLDIIIVTPEHLANIQQIGLLNHKVSEQSLLRIQDVTARVNGFWQTFFRYGTVVAETAGDEPNFLMENVSNPNSVASIILKLHEELIESGGLEEETGESVGLNRPMPVRKKRKEIINKIVYNLPPNKNLPADFDESQIQTPTEEKITELDDSKVVIIQTPKQEKKQTPIVEQSSLRGKVKIHTPKNSVKKIETSPRKSENTGIESSWIINKKTEEGELKEGEEIRL